MKKAPKALKIVLVIVLVLLVGVIALVALAPDPAEEPTTTQPAETTEAVPHRDEAVGISDKDCEEFLEGSTPHSMMNDVTGKWKLVTIATTNGDFENYAKSYAEKYLISKEENEVHWIVNFTNKTTTSIKVMSGIIFVDVYEYVDKEEHSAKDIGGGMLLASYLIYADNGDIEKID